MLQTFTHSDLVVGIFAELVIVLIDVTILIHHALLPKILIVVKDGVEVVISLRSVVHRVFQTRKQLVKLKKLLMKLLALLVLKLPNVPFDFKIRRGLRKP